MPYAMPQTQTAIIDDPAFRAFIVKARQNASNLLNDYPRYDKGNRKGYYDERNQWLYTDTQHGVNPFFGRELYSKSTDGKFIPFAQLAYDEAAVGDDEQIERMFALRRKMLLMGSSENLFSALGRGPTKYEEGDLVYHSDARILAGYPGRIIGKAEIVLKQWDPDVYYQLNWLFCCLR